MERQSGSLHHIGGIRLFGIRQRALYVLTTREEVGRQGEHMLLGGVAERGRKDFLGVQHPCQA